MSVAGYFTAMNRNGQIHLTNFIRSRWILFALIILQPIFAFAYSDSLTTPTKPLVIVLSGGGARGLAQIGALRVLEWNHIQPDMIVGSSMGGVIGALWASGYSTGEITKLFREFDWSGLLSDRPRRTALFLSKREYDQQGLLTLKFGPGGRPIVPTGLTTGQVLFTRLRHMFEQAPYQPTPSYDHLKIPLRVVCSDLANGKKIVFKSGDVTLACRGTVSYPLFFEPVPSEDRLLADGGIAESIPTQTAREEMPNAFVLAMDCTTPVVPKQVPSTPWEIADRVTSILQIDQNVASSSNADIVLKPVASKYTSTDFAEIDSMIASGEAAMLAALQQHPEIMQHIRSPKPVNNISLYSYPIHVSDRKQLEQPLSDEADIYPRLAEYHRKMGWVAPFIPQITRLKDRTYFTVQSPILREIHVIGTTKKYASLMKGESGLPIGEPLSKSDLDRTIDYLYGSGMFDFVYPIREAMPTGVKLTLLVKERTLPLLRLGAGYDSHRGGSGQAQLLYDNILGIATHGAATFQFGERDVISSVRFHADRVLGKFGAVDFEANATRTEWPTFKASRLSAISYSRFGGSAAIGQSIGRGVFVSAGARAVGMKIYENGTARYSRLTPFFTKLSIDTEDRSPFPNRGTRLLAGWETTQQKRNWSDNSYTRSYLYHIKTFKLANRWYLAPQFSAGYNNAGSPRSEWFRLGGPYDFWGIATGERDARNFAMSAVTIRWDLISRLVADTYIEFRANAAALSQENSLRWEKPQRLIGGGAAIALSTWLGPVRLVWSWAGDELPKARPMVSFSLGSSIPNPLEPRPVFK